MRLALDAMGGDHAPEMIIQGALEAAALIQDSILLVGPPDVISRHLPTPAPRNIEIVPASQYVEMDEKPTDAYRNKKDSSMMVCAQLVHDGRADAFISAGNTGAATTFSLMTWRQMQGIHRPAIASLIPSINQEFVLLDAGASPDVSPRHLVEFAVMGRAYVETTLGRKNPTVHLLNIGEEEGKGNAFAKEAFDLLKPHPWFRGNIEGKAVFHEQCDVVVCDAFVGNIFLKTSEGVAELIVKLIRDAIPTNPVQKVMYLPMRKAMAPLRSKLDYATYGGSPLLGLNGICVICHGRSNAKAIKNALLQASKMAHGRLVEVIRTGIEGCGNIPA